MPLVLSGPWGTSMIPELDHYELGGPEGDCWEWALGRHWDGYGQLRYKGVTTRAHRLSYQIAHPEEDIKGKVILHRCDNPCCINPAHLTCGSQRDNMKDMKRKGRQYHPSGKLNPHCKLNEQQVSEIRALKGKQSQAAIGKLYGVSQRTVSLIHRGEIWNSQSPMKLLLNNLNG